MLTVDSLPCFDASFNPLKYLNKSLKSLTLPALLLSPFLLKRRESAPNMYAPNFAPMTLNLSHPQCLTETKVNALKAAPKQCATCRGGTYLVWLLNLLISSYGHNSTWWKSGCIFSRTPLGHQKWSIEAKSGSQLSKLIIRKSEKIRVYLPRIYFGDKRKPDRGCWFSPSPHQIGLDDNQQLNSHFVNGESSDQAF